MMKKKTSEKASSKATLLYVVKNYSDFNEPYAYSDGIKDIVKHKTYDEYETDDEETFYKVLNDFLDAPKKKLTAEDVRKDFDEMPKGLSDTRVHVIMDYYNGRYELSRSIFAKLKKIKLDKIHKDFPVVMKFKIPFSMNYFSTTDNDPYDNYVKMNDAYISIEISRIGQTS